ncbi:Calcium-binding EF-hand protein [Quillaja saponaria]|uniref:Calcium-binding EF-hand protein n=1 Tax=Quillaja saponaria TaxID=32244 RepID=A0AAD7LW16_QUISA|nr:Calcium-binding EF-hand protein [Quillaja saponaria]
MAKAAVYTLIATAFVVFIIFSPISQHNSKCVGLNRRLGYNVRHPTFDPLVAKMERFAEEKEGLGHHSNTIKSENFKLASEMVEVYEYLTEGRTLNITLRLVILFPLLDRQPKDGMVSFNELETWITKQAMERLNYTTGKEMETKDKNGDKLISFKEYLPQFSDKDIEKNAMGHGEAGWWMDKFTSADIDQNGYLNFTEFKDFLHPEDSKNVDVKKWLLTEKLSRMDYDNDSKLNFVEFRDHAYRMYIGYVEFETNGLNPPTAEEKFAELDVNKDKFLSVGELIPFLHYLQPGELSYAKYYTNYLINEADDNKDGKLILQEMLNHENIFYSSAYGDNHDDDDHDEL